MSEKMKEDTPHKNRRGLKDVILPVGVMAMLVFLLGAVVFHADPHWSLHNVPLAGRPAFSAAGIMDGSYQSGWGAWLNDNFYGHTAAIKLHNQIQYSVFRDGNGDWEVGRDQMIYSKGNAYSYAAGGRGAADQAVFDAYAEQVAQMQAKLGGYGKDFVYLLTPLKVEIYPESLSWYDRIVASRHALQGENNRDKIIKAFEKYGVHYLDMKDDILALRQTADYEVYAKTGHHWTLTAAANEMNALFSHIGPLTPHISYPTVTVTGTKDELYATDIDIYRTENIFAGRMSDRYTSPVVEYERSDNKVYYFGTSMGLTIVNALAQDQKYRAFDSYTFQEYFNYTVSADSAGKVQKNYRREDLPSAIGVMERILDSDLVIMESCALAGLNDTHKRFVGYVNENIDKLYYKIGDDLITYNDDAVGAAWENFYGPESWGRWSKEDSTVTVYGDALKGAGADIRLRLNMRSYHEAHTVDVAVNGVPVASFQALPAFTDYTVEIPAAAVAEKENAIELRVREELYSPQEVGEAQDARYLGLGIASMVLEVSG